MVKFGNIEFFSILQFNKNGTWYVTHCNDENTQMSLRRDKITAKIIFYGHMF